MENQNLPSTGEETLPAQRLPEYPIGLRARAEPLVVTPEYVQQQVRSLALLQDLVRDVLVEGRDYGRVPGTQQFLWDPGANQIFGAFNVYPGHRRILSLVDDGLKISVIVEVPLIQRNTGAEIGSGIGASSTEETKHKYRWVKEDELEVWGYNEESAKSLKTKKNDYGDTLYRIPNPEHAELLNVCIKQSSKRAEVDGAESLPGVASALREIFSPKKERKGKEVKGEELDEASPRWTKFWGEVRALGIVTDAGVPDSAKVHQELGVASMKDWLASGKSLDDAIRVLSKKFGKKTTRDPKTIKTLDDLKKACHDDFGLSPEQMVRELGYSRESDISELPSECYKTIAAVR